MSETFIQKYAPQTLKDVVLNGDNKRFAEPDFNLGDSANLLFIGKPGTGKTTIAKLLAKEYDYLYVNASDENGVDTIRTKVTDFIKTSSLFGGIKVVILDEADGLSSVSTGNGSSAQQALRGLIEENLDHCRFILTANYEHKIIDALQSRCQTFHFKLTKRDCAVRLAHIIKAENITTTKEDLGNLINSHFPDLRKCINELQKGTKDGTFVYKKVVSTKIPLFIKVNLENKTNVFEIRKEIIKIEDEFQGDYHSLMRGLFDLYCKESNRDATLAICQAMEKHNVVLDKEVNFTSLLLTLSHLFLT